MKTAREWKAYYAAERAALGPRGLAALVHDAPDVAMSEAGALVFPHTRLAESGVLVAAAARAVVRSGADVVLALGVLHGAREEDRDLVARARAGEEAARTALRRVHGDGLPGDEGRWSEEFSLDNFRALLDAAAHLAHRRPPRVIACFPFLTGDAPGTLGGIDTLRTWRARGAPIVATADMVHHGPGYGTPPAACIAHDTRGLAYARGAIEGQLARLCAHEYTAFQEEAAAARSDFRDAGPVLSELLGGWRATVDDVRLVDYAEALAAAPPTWVAAALVRAEPA